MKLYEVTKAFVILASDRDFEYYRRLKEGAKLIYLDDSPIPTFQQTVFERIWPPDMIPFMDRLKEIEYEIAEGENILKTVHSYNIKGDFSKRVNIAYDGSNKEAVAKLAEEYNNR